LGECKQRQTESIEAFVGRLNNLVTKAYPNQEKNFLDTIIKTHFLRGLLNKNIQELVLNNMEKQFEEIILKCLHKEQINIQTQLLNRDNCNVEGEEAFVANISGGCTGCKCCRNHNNFSHGIPVRAKIDSKSLKCLIYCLNVLWICELLLYFWICC
jgi:hypothetical protein